MSAQNGPPEGRYVQAGPIRMHYLEYGDENAPVVVFLHGSGPGNSAWANFHLNKDTFANAGYRVLMPDMIGFGYTDKPLNQGDYTLQLFCDTLMAGLEEMGVQKCSFVGNSLGGGVAIQIALDNPDFVEKLILMGPGCLEEQGAYWTMPGIAKMMEANKAGMSKEIQGDLMRLFTYDPKHVTQELIDMRWAVAQDQPKEVLTTMKTPELGSRMSELTCPILTFWGANDEFMPPQGKEKCLKANEQSRLIEVNACGHWVMIEHARMFNAASIDFLKNG
ncbi:alpha/beta fold hydrolase [Hellea balneolensis]|uniref:alpha/beta fold hydrolase n=1 Tax=Hellea balneolensis TaxID=287478 RepID=UPI000400CD7F|nr:alpha/beta hydrolase [Hellea balneolensis]